MDSRVPVLLETFRNISCTRDTHGPAAQLAVLEIAVSLCNAAQRIAVFDGFDSPQPGEVNDLAKVDGAAVEAGRELRAPGDLVQPKRNCLERGTDQSQPTEARQSGNPGLQRRLRAHTIEDEVRTGAGGDVTDQSRGARIAWKRIVCAVLLRQLQVSLVVVHRNDTGRT